MKKRTPFSYSRMETPDWYRCAKCRTTGVKLWRPIHDDEPLRCATCAVRHGNQVNKTSLTLHVDENGRAEDQCGERTDQVAGLLPAVFTEDGQGCWGYTSVPDDGCLWWNALPTSPTEPRRSSYVVDFDCAPGTKACATCGAGRIPAEKHKDWCVRNRHVDVHTEHCCELHGCKYSDQSCTVVSGLRQQSFMPECCEVNEQKYSAEWPAKTGFYWFCGKLKGRHWAALRPALMDVRVLQKEDGIEVTVQQAQEIGRRGEQFWPHDGTHGYWMPAKVPSVPAVPRPPLLQGQQMVDRSALGERPSAEYLASLIGKTREEAIQAVEDLGYRARLTRVDGSWKVVTRDLRNDRVNFEVEKDIVVKASVG